MQGFYFQKLKFIGVTDKEDKQDISEISDQIQIKSYLNLSKFKQNLYKKRYIFSYRHLRIKRIYRKYQDILAEKGNHGRTQGFHFRKLKFIRITDKEDKQDISEISDQIQIKFNLNLNKFK